MTGLNDLFIATKTYMAFVVLYKDCKWYQLIRKKITKEEMDFWYPLAKNEQKMSNNLMKEERWKHITK